MLDDSHEAIAWTSSGDQAALRLLDEAEGDQVAGSKSMLRRVRKFGGVRNSGGAYLLGPS
jgi:hypothetical protein